MAGKSIIGPLTSSLEDSLLVYAAILGSSSADLMNLRPPLPCLPKLLSHNGGNNTIGSLRLGKHTRWFNDVNSSEISDKCEQILTLLSNSHGCKVSLIVFNTTGSLSNTLFQLQSLLHVVEIVIPELEEMRAAHAVSIGSAALSSLTPYCEAGKNSRLSYDTRTSFAVFRSFSAADYITAQCLRRILMEYHMEIFKNVDVIVSPTTGMTAPVIPPDALKNSETNFQVTAYLMRFVLAAISWASQPYLSP